MIDRQFAINYRLPNYQLPDSDRMRVIAGSLKGRRLKAPDWDGLRPTSDKLRETLFNILAPRIAARGCSTCYAGTGALGIEALSRGAARRDVRRAGSPRAGADRGEPRALRRRDRLCYYPRPSALRAVDVARPGRSAVRHHAARSAVYDRAMPDGADPGGGGRACSPQTASRCSSTRRRQPAPDTAGRLVRSRDVVSGDSALTFYEVISLVTS